MYIASYFPKTTLTNHQLEKMFPEWSAEKIEQKIGIVSRYVAGQNETPLDLAEQACLRLFAEHADMKNSIDYLLFCTQNPDYILPGNASILQNRLGLPTSIGALDYNLGCSGYVYGLSLAKGLLIGKVAKNVLLVTAEAYTKRIHPKDKGNRSVFGDAATATIITENDAALIGEFVLGTDGTGAKNLQIKNGGVRYPDHSDEEKICGSGNVYTDNNLYMDGPEIFNFTIEAVPVMVEETLKKNNLKKDEIALFIFHQANSYILNFLRKLSRIPEERFYLNMRETGNTVSNTIPLALADSLKNGKLNSGDKVLIAGFGVGYSYAATILSIQ